MNKKKVLLGLDCSSAVCGYTIWDLEKDELISISSFEFKKDTTISEKGLEFKNFLLKIMDEYDVQENIIEASMVAMFGGFSSSATVATLNRINAVVQYICLDTTGKIKEITVQQARKHAFPSVKLLNKHQSKLSQKEQMFAVVQKELGDTFFPKKTITKGKRKGVEVYEDFCMDRSDSYILAKAYSNVQQNKRWQALANSGKKGSTVVPDL